MCRPACRACPLSWGTRTRYRPTGTCRPRRSCSRWLPPGSMPKAPGHERARPDPAVLLHRTADPATPSQPANGRLLPGHPAAAAQFRQRETGKAPSALDIDDLNARVISSFLDHLEAERHNTPRTRNARLGAIRSLFRYAALRHPEHAELIAQVLAIPQKRFAKATVSFLTPAELQALLAAPDLTTWEGRRTVRSSSSAPRPGCESPRSSGSTAATSAWAPEPTSAARAKAANSEPCPSPAPPRRCCANGRANAADEPRTRCSRPAQAGG